MDPSLQVIPRISNPHNPMNYVEHDMHQDDQFENTMKTAKDDYRFSH